MTCYESDVATVSWDGDLGGVRLHWNGFAAGEDLRRPMDECLELLADRGGDRMFADSREMGALRQDDQEWSLVDWTPRAERAGLRYLTIVYPESVVAKMGVDSVIDRADDEMERLITDDPDDAEEWIRTQ